MEDECDLSPLPTRQQHDTGDLVGHAHGEGAGEVRGRAVFPQLREREAWPRDVPREGQERHGGV